MRMIEFLSLVADILVSPFKTRARLEAEIILLRHQRPHPEQGFRACLGIVRLAARHGAERLEAAAERAIDIGARTYGSVKSILDNNLDRRPAQKRATDGTPILHSNIRGPRYYN